MIEQGRRSLHMTVAKSGLAQNVCILAGSMGGPTGMKRFFSNLPAQMPVAFLVAQHISAEALPLLCNFIARTTSMRVLPGLSGHLVRHGEVVVLPSDRRVCFTAEGKLELLTPKVPDVFPIDQVLHAAAQHYGRQAGAIIFSGIGEDSQRGCRALTACGAEVWTQCEGSSRFSSMPRYVRGYCQVAFTGTPECLAARLVDELGSSRRNTARHIAAV